MCKKDELFLLAERSYEVPQDMDLPATIFQATINSSSNNLYQQAK